MSIIGSLSNNGGGGGGGYENVTKVKSNCFKLNRAYPILFNSSNVGNFFLEWNSNTLYRSSGKERESHCLLLTSSTKLEIRQFQVVVVQ